MTEEQEFRKEVMQALAYQVHTLNQVNDAIGVLRVALEMLCAKHGDDPVALMEAARRHIELETEE